MPFGMFMMYLPSISLVTRRRFTCNPFSSAGWLGTVREIKKHFYFSNFANLKTNVATKLPYKLILCTCFGTGIGDRH